MAKQVRLTDVAKVVNVSTMTVSKAINGKPGVSKELREEILRVADEMGYTPNMAAKGLRSNSTRTIGVVGMFNDAQPGSITFNALHEVLHREGYNFALANHYGDIAKEREAIESVARKNVDGIIVLSPTLCSAKDMDFIASFEIPTVVLLRTVRHEKIDYVCCNDFKAFYEMTCYLISQGSRKFAFLAYKKNDRRLSQIGGRRLRGFARALKEKDLDLPESNIEYGRVGIEDGYRATMALLERGCDFDALICSCDEMAVGAIEALNDSGLRVPEDVRVSGYDGMNYTKYLRVPLTTVEQPFAEVGRIGGELLLQRIQSPGLPAKRLELDCQLICRRSTE